MQRRVAHRIETLGSAPRPTGAEVLKGGQGELRIRIGDWRIIYVVHDAELLVLVIKIGHRGDVYRAR
jgi:mRNA interferase RelE/StbE